MKNDNCKQIEELLVDFADGVLDEQGDMLVRRHLQGCQGCRQTVKALEESLSMAQVIWDDNLTAAATKRHRHTIRYIQIAAGLLFAIGLFLAGYNANDKADTGDVEIAQAASLPTFEDIKLQIDMEGIAARLLAKANLIKRNPDRVPNADEHVQNEYRHIIQMYPETATAKKAAKLIRSN